MRRILAAIAVTSMLFGATAFAVSDGQYRPANNGCTPYDDNSKTPQHVGYNSQDVTKSCHSTIVTVSDHSGHQYLGYGIDQTPDGTTAHSGEIWIDPGQGTRYVWAFDINNGPDNITNPSYFAQQGTPADPATGLIAYFGMDDNVDFGEHDSSAQVHNGSSDGGAIKVDVDPTGVPALLAEISALATTIDAAGILSNPAPFASTGLGACADGVCASMQTQRRIAFAGGTGHRDVANYSNVHWDPYNCAGPTDTSVDCGGSSMASWAQRAAVSYVEPGLQIYEDPDPQGSPGVLSLVGLDQVKQALTGDGQDPYPIPALYIGTCGFVFGGGSDPSQPTWFPAGPGINNAGQIALGNPQLCG